MVELRTPKGTKDYSPKECFIYNNLIEKITAVFKKHGASNIDTPIFELREILCNKYGEESKLIFDLADQGGDICSLRYDLTVSFARYLASNKIQKIKRYQIGKVFRRDQPSIAKGRLREFIQCDFDIAGSYIPMLPDSEIILIIQECLSALKIGNFQIKINHREILASFVEIAGIPASNFASVCSTLDKLDKIPWNEIEKELLTKSVTTLQAQAIKKYVYMKGNKDLILTLKNDPIYNTDKGRKGVNDLEKLMEYLQIFKITEFVFDLSLARGLDYYTGIIFEAILDDYKDIGSVAGGGRYDNLVSSLIPSHSSANVPCIGFSFGITRILSILLRLNSESSNNFLKVYVAASGDFLLNERLYILNELWKANIPAETFYTKRSNFNSALENCSKNKIPYLLVVGAMEFKENRVKLIYGSNFESKFEGSLAEVIDIITSN